MTGPTYPGDTSKPATGLRWKDFEDKERWKLALGVWWRITVMSIGLWIGLTVLFVVLALVFSSSVE